MELVNYLVMLVHLVQCNNHFALMGQEIGSRIMALLLTLCSLIFNPKVVYHARYSVISKQLYILNS